MTRVHVLYEYGVDDLPHGSAYIRLLNPLRHPSLRGRIELSAGPNLVPADVVIVDRTWKYDVSLHDAENLLAAIRQTGARFIYHVDDNLLDLDLSGGFRVGFTLEQLTIIRLFAREADALWVSTVSLAERMRQLNPHVHVLPNALDEQLFSHRPPRNQSVQVNGRCIVGYMGTYTHEDDLYMILEALREYADRIELQLVGGLEDPRAIEGLKPLKVCTLQPDAGHEYPDFAQWMAKTLQWDIGLAPLEESLFTRCKSDIKFLDYSLLDIPGIYSRVEAYRHTVQDNVTGVLADNTVAAWRDALGRLIHDRDHRLRMAETARTWTAAHRTLAVCAGRWADAIDAVANGPTADGQEKT